jgi:hypothetical protein
MYGPRLNAPLMWDDRPFFVNVPAFDRPIPWSQYFNPQYFEFSGESSWRPMATLSYRTLVATVGRHPRPLRLSMFALHTINSTLIAFLLLALGLSSPIATAAAAFFLIHPAHIETLMCITFNEELLMTFGVLTMLLAHLRRRPFVAAIGLSIAVLSKETGILGPVLVAMLDIMTHGLSEIKKRTRDYILYGAVSIIYLLVRFGPMKGPSAPSLSALLPWSERLYSGARGLTSSLRVLLAPVHLRIEYFALPAASPWQWLLHIVLAVGLIAGILFFARSQWRNNRILSFFALWPLPILFLTSNVIPAATLSLRLMAERWLYLPAVGFVTVIAFLLKDRPIRLRLLLLTWSALGIMRLQAWSTEPALWRSLESIYPWSAKAAEGLGEALFRSGETAEAQSAFERGQSLRRERLDLVLTHYVPLAPAGTIGWESASSYRWLGLCRLRLGDTAGTIHFFKRALELQPSDIFSYRVLAYISARDGNFDQARQWLSKGLARDADDSFLLRVKHDVASGRLTFVSRFD